MKDPYRSIAWIGIALATSAILVVQIDRAIAEYLISIDKYDVAFASRKISIFASATTGFLAFLVGGFIAKHSFVLPASALAAALQILTLRYFSDWFGTSLLDQLSTSWPAGLAFLLSSIGAAALGMRLRRLLPSQENKAAT